MMMSDELVRCRYCRSMGKQYTHEGRNYIGAPGWVSVCYCMMCGTQVEAFDESPIRAEEKAASWWNRGIYDARK